MWPLVISNHFFLALLLDNSIFFLLIFLVSFFYLLFIVISHSIFIFSFQFFSVLIQFFFSSFKAETSIMFFEIIFFSKISVKKICLLIEMKKKLFFGVWNIFFGWFDFFFVKRTMDWFSKMDKIKKKRFKGKERIWKKKGMQNV